MNTNKNIFYEQQILAMSIANIFNKDIKKKLKVVSKKKSIFPSIDSIYNKEIIKENDPDNKTNTSASSKKTYNMNEYNDSYSYYDDDYNEPGMDLTKERSESFTSKPKTSNNISVDEPKSKSPKLDKSSIISDKINSNQSDKITEDSSTRTDDEILDKKCHSVQRSLYCHRNKSRFQFVTGEMSSRSLGDCVPTENVPNFVLDIINKNSSRFSFFKKFENEFIIDKKEVLINKDSKLQDNTWSEFIMSDLYTK